MTEKTGTNRRAFLRRAAAWNRRNLGELASAAFGRAGSWKHVRRQPIRSTDSADRRHDRPQAAAATGRIPSLVGPAGPVTSCLTA